MNDAESLKERVDCRDVVAADLGKPAKKSSKVHHWLCPFHADRKTPSLAVYADGFKCFGCDEHGDAIAWVMKRGPLDFPEACRRLGADPSAPTSGTAARRPAPKPSILEPPDYDWQFEAFVVAYDCRKLLWSDAGTWALEYLRDRGLNDYTIEDNWLGLQPEDGDRNGLFVPRGIVIPYRHNKIDTWWALKVRRAEGEPKYTQVKGGKASLYRADSLAGQDVAVVCEGEFDTLLLAQHVGDLVAVFTFGGAASHDVDAWLPYLLHLKRLLIATDNDKSGEEAWQYWKRKTKRAKRLAPPGGAKDITDAWKDGADLRAWVLDFPGECIEEAT